MVREDIKFDQIDTSEFNEEFLAISFISENRKIALATIYNPLNIKPNIDNFKHILNRFPHSIFWGDFNSKHEYFKCRKSNKEGDYLFNIVEELNLLVMNDASPTFYKNTTAPGDILDLAIMSRSMATRVATCEIGLGVGSDHLPVHLTINSSKIIRQNRKEILQHEKTDCSRFKKYIINNLIMTEAEWPSEIDVACDTLAKIIKAALDKSCPKSKVKYMDFFISKETSKLIKLKRQIRRIAQKTQDPIHKRLANQLKIIVAKAVKNDQDTWWRKNTKDLDGQR